MYEPVAMSATPATAPSPETIGRYRIEAEIGRGSTGVVYRATDTLIGRSVALKVLRAHDRPGRDSKVFGVRRASFLREARSAGALSHPGIVTVYDVLEDAAGDLVLAMELVEGTDLATLLAEGGLASFEEIVDLVGQVAEALDHLHAQGLVHRDVKPANILITGDGRVKLTDLGIASGVAAAADEVEQGMVIGTPVYMPPEQLMGEPTTERADIYGLGVVLYEMLAGRRPFSGDTIPLLVREIVHEPAPPPPDVPGVSREELRALVDRALAKDPEARFGSAGALFRALSGLLYRSEGDRPPEATVSGGDGDLTEVLDRTDLARSRRGGRRFGRRRLVVAALVVLGMVMGAGIVGLVMADRQAETLERAARLAAGGERRAVQGILQQGEELLAEGQPAEAALLFEAAERLSTGRAEDLPAWQRVARLRREAERQADELAAAASTLVGQEDDAVLEAARRLLAERQGSDGPAALETLVAERGRSRPAPAGDESLEPSATAPAPAVLEIALASAAPKGVLVAYADGRQIFRRPFEFREDRRFWFDRPTAGSFEEIVTVPRGTEDLSLYVVRGGEAAQRLEVPGPFPDGTRRSVELNLPAEGEPELAVGG